jgi:hypothetical protein
VSADKSNKTCVHCDKVLPEPIDTLDLFGGLCGLCEGCRSWKRVHYAEVEKRILEKSSNPSSKGLKP